MLSPCSAQTEVPVFSTATSQAVGEIDTWWQEPLLASSRLFEAGGLFWLSEDQDGGDTIPNPGCDRSGYCDPTATWGFWIRLGTYYPRWRSIAILWESQPGQEARTISFSRVTGRSLQAASLGGIQPLPTHRKFQQGSFATSVRREEHGRIECTLRDIWPGKTRVHWNKVLLHVVR